MVPSQLLVVINEVRRNRGREDVSEVHPYLRLREDFEFSSLDLAELAVRIEDRFGVDVFADGVVFTVEEVIDRIAAARR